MKHTGRYLFFVLLAINLTLASWYVIHNDVIFTSDIARDFWLLEELAEKKLVLIGPRASGELYHGPLWTYLSYPAFAIGKGNPVVVEWWWILLAAAATAGNVVIAKKLFGELSGYVFALITSLYYTFHTRGFSHPHGAMLLLPFWFFLFIRYMQKGKPAYLISHLVGSGMLIQFELAIGIPYAGLSSLALIWFMVKEKRYVHLPYLAILPAMLSNFILFDLRHNHILLAKIADFVGPHQEGALFDYTTFVGERVRLLFSATEILRRDPGGRNMVLFVLLLAAIVAVRKDRKLHSVHMWFLYFWTGFFLVSFIDKGPILYFHLYPQFPLVFFAISSLASSRYKNFVIGVLAVVYALNIYASAGDLHSATKGFIGVDRESWKAQHEVAKYVFKGSEKTLGYFVFSPDITGYAPKYAMRYAAKTSSKKSFVFTKLPITYLILSPPPRNNPSMNGTWWRKNQLGITKDPVYTQQFASGFVVEKYELTSDEQTVPFDPALDPGLHFR